jgi:hypothetical protein
MSLMIVSKHLFIDVKNSPISMPVKILESSWAQWLIPEIMAVGRCKLEDWDPKAGAAVQVVGLLPFNHKALSSNPSTAKRKMRDPIPKIKAKKD